MIAREKCDAACGTTSPRTCRSLKEEGATEREESVSVCATQRKQIRLARSRVSWRIVTAPYLSVAQVKVPVVRRGDCDAGRAVRRLAGAFERRRSGKRPFLLLLLLLLWRGHLLSNELRLKRQRLGGTIALVVGGPAAAPKAAARHPAAGRPAGLRRGVRRLRLPLHERQHTPLFGNDNQCRDSRPIAIRQDCKIRTFPQHFYARAFATPTHPWW